MRRISIITDFGDSHYSGIIKGVILRINSNITIIDITNHILPQNIVEGAFVLRESLPYFDENTVFLTVVDPGVGSDRKGIVVYSQGQYFVGPDNGIFEYVYRRGEYKVWEIVKNDFYFQNISSTFHARDIFAPLAAFIASEKDISDMVSPLKNPIRLRIEEPVVEDRKVTGKILYIDSFGNLITNIPADFAKKYICSLKIKNRRVGRIKKAYSDVPKGVPLALVGSSGMIEIAVNGGSAEKRFNIKRDRLDKITVTVFLRNVK